MSSLPTSAALNIVRTALPEITEAFYQQLAAGLMKDMPVSKEAEKQTEDKNTQGEAGAPIPNGNSNDKKVDPNAGHTSPYADGVDPWDYDALLAQAKEQAEPDEQIDKTDDVPEPKDSPIANGKKSQASQRTTGKEQASAERGSQSTTREPIANGKKRSGAPSGKKRRALWVETVAKSVRND